MAATVMTHHMSEVDIDVLRVKKYALISGDVTENMNDLISECMEKMKQVLNCNSCFVTLPVSIDKDSVSFDGIGLESKNLSKLLIGCDKAIFLCATIGHEADMLIKRAEVTSKAEALILNAVASAAIESYLNILNEYFKTEFKEYDLRPRFSPGYGDVKLEFQKELIPVLDTKRKIGVTLTDTCLMRPSKSVTAIIGLGKGGCIHLDRECDECDFSECGYRLLS